MTIIPGPDSGAMTGSIVDFDQSLAGSYPEQGGTAT